MTNPKILSYKNKLKTTLIFSLTFIAALTLSIRYPDRIRDGITEGITYTVFTVFPTMFPFALITDYAVSNGLFTTHKQRKICKLFGLSDGCYTAIIYGNLFGAPFGARYLAEAYRRGAVSGSDVERTIGLSSNPSVPFIIVAITGATGDFRIGFAVMSAVITSSLITGVLFREKTHLYKYSSYNVGQSYDLTKSIKDSFFACVNACAFIIFFSYLLSAFSILITDNGISNLIYMTFEVGNGIKKIASFSNKIRIAAMAFCVGFSGLSIHLQTRSLIPREIPMGLYFAEKITEGIISAISAYALSEYFL